MLRKPAPSRVQQPINGRSAANPKQAYAVLMKRLLQYALVAAFAASLAVLPGLAQRGGGHGASGHASGGFHSSGGGGFHSAPSRGFGGPARSSGYPGAYAGNRARIPMQSYRGGLANNAYGRSGYGGHDGHRRPYISSYRNGYPYLVAPYYGYPGYGYLGYGDDTDNSDQSAAAAPPDSGSPYDAPPPEPDQYAFRPPYPAAPAPPSPQSAQLSQDAVTLIYKDGRPSEQVHNYILTPTTLYVQDQQHRAIPTDQLDLVATAKANQDAGVSFQLPNTAQ